MDSVIKMFVLLVGASVLIVGIYLAQPVVTHIANFAKAPEKLSENVDSFAELIDAESLQLPIKYVDADTPERFRFGKVVATAMLMFANLLWLYVPVILVKTGCSILLSGVHRQSSPAASMAQAVV